MRRGEQERPETQALGTSLPGPLFPNQQSTIINRQVPLTHSATSCSKILKEKNFTGGNRGNGGASRGTISPLLSSCFFWSCVLCLEVLCLLHPLRLLLFKNLTSFLPLFFASCAFLRPFLLLSLSAFRFPPSAFRVTSHVFPSTDRTALPPLP